VVVKPGQQPVNQRRRIHRGQQPGDQVMQVGLKRGIPAWGRRLGQFRQQPVIRSLRKSGRRRAPR